MTPKEKARDLVDKFTSFEVTVLGCGKDKGNPCIVSDKMSLYDAKIAAVIAVDEILDELTNHEIVLAARLNSKFWQSVKQEIITLNI